MEAMCYVELLFLGSKSNTIETNDEFIIKILIKQPESEDTLRFD